MSTSDRPIINMKSQFERWNDLRRLRSRVVNVFAGDSNCLFSTDGYNDGCERALALAGVPIFASALLGFGGSSNLGVGSIGSDIQASAVTEALASVPSQLTGLIPSANYMGMLQPYWRNTNVTNGNGAGYQLAASSALGNNAALRGHLWFGTGPSWGGTVPLAFRQDSSPFTQHVTASRVLTGAGGAAWGLRRETLDIAAGVAAAAEPLLLCQYRPGTAQTAPIFCPFAAIERPDRAAGAMVTPLIFAPSQHLGTIESTYRTGCPDAWKIAHMQALDTLDGPNGTIAWWVSSGINDQSASRTSAQFVADFDRFRAEVLRISDLAGVSRERHVFVAMPTHPQNSATPDGVLRGYVSALAAYAASVPNVLVVNLHAAAFGDSTAWAARHDGGGAAHLKNTTAGYTSAMSVVWDRLFAAAEEYRRRGVAVRAVGSGVV